MKETNEAGNTIISTTDQELIISRTLSANRELVFQAWTDPAHLPHWWGPRGFTITVQEIQVEVGGHWRFVMHGPDGVDYDNLIVYHEVVRPERIVYGHGDAESEQFRVIVTFEELGSNTQITMRMQFPSFEALKTAVEQYGAIEDAKSTLELLEEWVGTR